MSEYNIYPAVDDNLNFAPAVRLALAESGELIQATTDLVPLLINQPDSDVRKALDELLQLWFNIIDGGSP